MDFSMTRDGPHTGQLWKKYNGDICEIVACPVKRPHNIDTYVVYRFLVSEPRSVGTWVRPLMEFMEDVEVDGHMVHRFERYDHNKIEPNEHCFA